MGYFDNLCLLTELDSYMQALPVYVLTMSL